MASTVSGNSVHCSSRASNSARDCVVLVTIRPLLRGLSEPACTSASHLRNAGHDDVRSGNFWPLCPDRTILRLNRALCTIPDYSEPELLATTMRATSRPDEIDLMNDLIQRTIAAELEQYRVEKRYIRTDSQSVCADLSISLVRDEDGATAARHSLNNEPNHFAYTPDENVLESKHAPTSSPPVRVALRDRSCGAAADRARFGRWVPGQPQRRLLSALLGFLGLFLELSTPGATIPGAVGVVCLILAAIGLSDLPFDWRGALLILVAFLLFVADLFVPSLGALTITGLALPRSRFVCAL